MRYLRKFNENFDGEKHYTKELFNAVESGDINKVKELLESGADPDDETEGILGTKTYKSVRRAIKDDRLDILKLFLEYGCTGFSTDRIIVSRVPFEFCKFDIVEYLVDQNLLKGDWSQYIKFIENNYQTSEEDKERMVKYLMDCQSGGNGKPKKDNLLEEDFEDIKQLLEDFIEEYDLSSGHEIPNIDTNKSLLLIATAIQRKSQDIFYHIIWPIFDKYEKKHQIVFYIMCSHLINEDPRLEKIDKGIESLMSRLKSMGFDCEYSKTDLFAGNNQRVLYIH